MEKLRAINSYNGNKVKIVMLSRKPPEEKILLSPSSNSIAFKLQKGASKEKVFTQDPKIPGKFLSKFNGVNGCDPSTIIEFLIEWLKTLDSELSCEENKKTILHLDHAIHYQNLRERDREIRGVIGQDKL